MGKMQVLKIFLLALWTTNLPNCMCAQSVNLGNPPVENYSKRDYNAGTQVWSMAQDAEGVLWFGNNSGLLEFDGTHWRLYPLDNRTIVRSVQVGPHGQVFVGGQDEFGYFKPDRRGTLTYHSLRQLLPVSEQRVGDVWNILVRPEGIFFRTDHQVFLYPVEGGALRSLFPTGSSLTFIGEWQGRVLVQDSAGKLYTFDNGSFAPLNHPAEFTLGRVSGLLQVSPDTMLVTTLRNGIFYFDGTRFVPWTTQDDTFLRNNNIYCASLLNNGQVALGTSLGGLVTIDRHRRIFHHLNKKSGLQNNTVLSLLALRDGGLWLGLDNGTSFADLESPFSTIYPDGDLQGTGYTARVFQNKIYFGTNTGLYATDWKPYYAPRERQQFSLVGHTQGQVWGLNEVGGSLLMGHHEGAFEVNGLQARLLTNLPGVWKFVPLSDGYAVAGHYNGMALLKQQGRQWAFESLLRGLTESSRLLGKDPQGHLWMAHPYRGIFRVAIDEQAHSLKAAFFNRSNGLPGDAGNHLFQLNDQVFFTGETGIFTFSDSLGQFVHDARFERFLGSGSCVRYLNQDANGNIWYVRDRDAGILQVRNNALEKQVFNLTIPELCDKQTAGFQFILPIDPQNTFIATDHGFTHFNLEAYLLRAQDSTLRLVLHEVRLQSGPDSVLFGGHGAMQNDERADLNAHQNTLHFAFSTPDAPGNKWIRYSHYLKGADITWSDWLPETELVYNNLPPGDYTFYLKARNQYGVESTVRTFRFRILPPWYASSWAYGLYVLMAIGLMLGIIYRQQRRFAREKKGLEDLHQESARRSEEAINRLQNEHLAAEVRHKNQELASATLHIVQKSEILSTIKEALEKLKNKVSNAPELGKEIGRIIKLFEQDARTDADWEQFSHHFDQVHSDFLKRLREQYAHLSPNDYKLCAYLRLNLTSKEIAALMNISIRSVESGRYRLRKRLGLDTESNLTEFLMRF